MSVDEEFLRNLPAEPGVYLMSDRRGRVLYVGKAANLRNRVRTYFGRGGDDRPSVKFLVPRVHSVRTIVTETEKEALILENNLIKEHRPNYNVNLRDDKSFFSLKLNITHPFPRLSLVRTQKIKPDGERYFGPYASARDARLTLKSLQKVFPFRQCTDKQLISCKRPCLNCQMKRCLCPCTGKVDRGEYSRMVRGASLMLQGRREDLLNNLRQEMLAASEKLKFEEAARTRDRLAALERTLEAQNVAFFHRKDQDVIAIVEPETGLFVIQVLAFRKGNLLSQDSFVVRNPALDEMEVLSSAIKQYYYSGAFIPKEVFISRPVEQPELIETWLTEFRGNKVRLRMPTRGSGVNLINLAVKNAHNAWLLEQQKNSLGEALSRLAIKLRLSEPPSLIEGYDISNTAGNTPIGVKVLFRDGKPDKSGYRHYSMKGFSDQDDPGMINQTVARRLGHVETEPLPDLLLIDGGKTQLNAALEAVRSHGQEMRPAIVAIAKANVQCEMDRIYLPERKNPVSFSRGDPGLMLLMRVRDEAHRFAHGAHTKKRISSVVRSELNDVPGIGPIKRRALLVAFGSLAALLKASDDDILAVKGLRQKDVQLIRDYFLRT